jgi:uncharacterized protein YgiM (DUF1202 family)
LSQARTAQLTNTTSAHRPLDHLAESRVETAGLLATQSEQPAARPIITIAQTNLRKGPRTDSEILTLIPKGTTVAVGDCGAYYRNNVIGGPRQLGFEIDAICTLLTI